MSLFVEKKVYSVRFYVSQKVVGFLTNKNATCLVVLELVGRGSPFHIQIRVEG